MNVAFHQRTKRRIDCAMPGQRCESDEAFADHDDAEMAAAIASPCMTDVQMTFINDLKFTRREVLAQDGFDQRRSPVRTIAHGSTCLKGCTSTSSNT